MRSRRFALALAFSVALFSSGVAYAGGLDPLLRVQVLRILADLGITSNGVYTPPEAGGGVTVTQVTITATGTWDVPANVYSVLVECWGGGGGGACYTSASSRSGGGGGGGGYSSQLVGVYPGVRYVVTVGSGGAAGVSTGLAGTTGGITSFKRSGGAGAVNNSGYANATNVFIADFLCVAQPGIGGSASTTCSGGLATDVAAMGETCWSGGGGGSAATTGNINGGGGGAGAGHGDTASGAGGAGTTGVGTGLGGTAPTGGGAGGNGGTSGGAATGGSIPGGGGGGGHFGTLTLGGAGARGQIRLTYLLPN